MTSTRMLDCLAALMAELHRERYTGPVTVKTDEGLLTVHVAGGAMKRAVLSAEVSLAIDTRAPFDAH